MIRLKQIFCVNVFVIFIIWGFFDFSKGSWLLDTDFQNNLDQSVILWEDINNPLTKCARMCDRNTSCISFFYHSSLQMCLGSSSYKRGLPANHSVQQGWQYYTKPQECDQGYVYHMPLDLCYKLHSENRNYNDAMTECEKEGAKLIIIRTESQFFYIQHALIDAVNAGSFFGWPKVGLRELVEGGGWKWWDGQVASDLNWKPYEPNNGGGNENCVEFAILDGFLYNDVNCGGTQTFICQKYV